jgi:hypothetical protein
MVNRLSRRTFLQKSLLSVVGAGVLHADSNFIKQVFTPLGRITTSNVRVRQKPFADAEVVYQILRDDLIQLYDQMEVDDYRNPIWYRIWGGFVHSSYVQPVQFNYQDVRSDIPEEGCLFEVSVPYTRSYVLSQNEWIKNYRLYYNSTHWVSGVKPGPDGNLWYQIVDSYNRSYYVNANHMRKVEFEEIAPISPQIPRNKKHVEVSIGNQELIAYEEGNIVLRTKMSSGLPLNRPLEPDEIPTETPLGDFFITVKTVSRHMGDKKLTQDLDSGAYPGVPWVCFFDKAGYSLHGTYWHNNFGNRMSHGCVNMPCEAAKWIYRWALPAATPEQWQTDGWGIRVSIRE